MKKTGFISLALLLLLSTCATLDTALIEDVSNRVELEDLKLEMDAEVYHLRADLIRQTTEEKTTSIDETGSFGTEEEEVDVPYHYVGVRFGNGLFLDYNQNLSVDLVEFFGLDERDFSIIQKVKSRDLFSPPVHYSRTGNEFVREEKVLLGRKTTGKLGENEIVLEEGLFKTEVLISLDDDRILCQPQGVFGLLGKAEITRDEEGNLAIPGLWKDVEFKWTGPDSIEMDKFFTISQADKEIVIDYKGLFGLTLTYRFIRIPDGFIFFDEKFHGVMAEKKGNKIIVSRDQSEIFSAVIE